MKSLAVALWELVELRDAGAEPETVRRAARVLAEAVYDVTRREVKMTEHVESALDDDEEPLVIKIVVPIKPPIEPSEVAAARLARRVRSIG